MPSSKEDKNIRFSKQSDNTDYTEQRAKPGSDSTIFGERDKWVWQTPRQRKCRKILESAMFENFMSVLIIGNFILIIIETDWLADDDHENVPSWIMIPSWSILVIFVIEMMVRLYSEHLIFFHDGWNLFDFLVIVCDFFFSCASLVLDQTLPIGVLRLLRLMKVARVSKLFRFFPELRLMAVGLMGAMRAMLWGTVLLFIALLVLSIVAVQIIHPLNREVAKTGVYRGCDRCEKAFHSVMASTLTFSQQILAGDSWGLVSIPIIEEYPGTALFFASVYLIIGVAILNLILGLVVDVAQQARKQFEHDLEFKQLLQQREKQSHLMGVCRDMDEDKSGMLTKDELFEGYDKNPEFRATLDQLGVEKEDMEVVWICLDSDKSGSVSYTEFVEQLYSMRASDTDFMIAYIKYYITIIKDEMFTGLDTLKTEITTIVSQTGCKLDEVELKHENSIGLPSSNVSDAEIAAISNTPLPEVKKTPEKYPEKYSQAMPAEDCANVVSPRRAQFQNTATDVMEEIKRNQAELRQRFCEMERKVDRSMLQSVQNVPKPAGEAMSLWPVCQKVTIQSADRLGS